MYITSTNVLIWVVVVNIITSSTLNLSLEVCAWLWLVVFQDVSFVGSERNNRVIEIFV